MAADGESGKRVQQGGAGARGTQDRVPQGTVYATAKQPSQPAVSELLVEPRFFRAPNSRRNA